MPALSATLADIGQRGITRVVCLGDLAGKGPDGPQSVDVCRERCERVIRGNWDDGLATGVKTDPALRWHQERLGDDRLAYLRALPNSMDLIMSDHRIRLFHASPQGVYTRVYQ